VKRPQILIFDLDDTLTLNSVTYNQPFIDFILFLTEIFNKRIPYAGSIARFQEDTDFGLGNQINPRTGSPYNFSHDRFPESFVRTYKWLCEQGFGEYDEGTAVECRQIGMRAFEQTNYRRLGLVDGAEQVLNFLRRKKQRLVMVSKGDPWVQDKKINALNLKHWFHEPDIYIVEAKNQATYLKVLEDINQRELALVAGGEWVGEYDPNQVVMVGNSFSSDIKPALEAGMSGVFIPCATWKGECINPSELTDSQRERLVIMKKISEFIPWYQSLEA
jgi:putative hydrolase of the HAD superfamily